MKNFVRILPVLSLIVGIGLGYLIWGYEKEIPLSFRGPLTKQTQPITLKTAKDRIKSYRDATKDTVSWAIQASSVLSIINQLDSNRNIMTHTLRFYPAYDETFSRKTYVFIGETKEGNLVDQRYIPRIGGSMQKSQGEIWDYIGPCPPFQNCPQTDILKLP